MKQTPLGFVRLFHVTPGRNAKSILKRGLLIRKSQGKYKRVWLCDGLRLNWALVHVAKHHNVQPENLRVFTVEINPHFLVRLREGVFCTWVSLPASVVEMTA